MTGGVVVCGAPRSGTSLCMGMLEACGVEVGRKERGFISALLEWGPLREQVVKVMLEDGGYDRYGQRKLPPVGWDPENFFYWVEKYEESVRKLREGGVRRGHGRWGVKAIKGAYAPGVLARAFEGARFLWVEREEEEHVEALMRCGFMVVHGKDREGWRGYVRWHWEVREALRLELEARGYELEVVEPGRMREEGIGYWEGVLERLNLRSERGRGGLEAVVDRGRYLRAGEGGGG